MEVGVALAFLLTLITTVSSLNITCNSRVYDYDYEKTKCCEIKDDDFIVSSEYQQLNIDRYSNEFKGFWAEQKSISYLPSGIEKCCGTFEVLIIKNSGLKDITSTNLQSFPNVIVLDLSFNMIQILEAGLFDSNLKIQKLYLNGNKISAIVSSVFDKLPESSYLYMNGNDCKFNESNPNGWITIKYMRDQLKAKHKCTKDEDIKTGRLMIKVEKIEANFGFIYNLISNRANDEESNLTDTIYHMKTAIQDLKNDTKYTQLDNKIGEIEQKQSNYKELKLNIDYIQLQLNQSIHRENAIKINPGIPEMPLYICSFLLLSILVALTVIIYRIKGPSSTSKTPAKLQSVCPNEITTVTQINEDDAPVEPLERDYDSLEPYGYYKSNKSRSNDSQNVPTYGNQSYANEIYGTTIVEDLYSEQISPKRANNIENVEDESSLYAVVSKPQRK